MYIGLGTLVVVLVVVAIIYFGRRAQKIGLMLSSPKDRRLN